LSNANDRKTVENTYSISEEICIPTRILYIKRSNGDGHGQNGYGNRVAHSGLFEVDLDVI